MRAWQHGVILLTIGALAAGCGPTARSGSPGAAGSESASANAPAKLKRITVAIRGAPVGLAHERARGIFVRVPGLDALEQLVTAGLAVPTDANSLVPQLAEALPTLDNGLWQLLPDGRMETRWKLRPGAAWQDGTPLTTADLLFATTVEQDKDTGVLPNPIYDLIERIDAIDQSTVSVAWRRPYL